MEYLMERNQNPKWLFKALHLIVFILGASISNIVVGMQGKTGDLATSPQKTKNKRKADEVDSTIQAPSSSTASTSTSKKRKNTSESPFDRQAKTTQEGAISSTPSSEDAYNLLFLSAATAPINDGTISHENYTEQLEEQEKQTLLSLNERAQKTTPKAHAAGTANLKATLNMLPELRPFQCLQCRRSYTAQSSLNFHIKNKHNPESPEIQVEKYKCDGANGKCKAAFKYSKPLITHKKRHVLYNEHASKGIKPIFACNNCQVEFDTEESFKKHRTKYNCTNIIRPKSKRSRKSLNAPTSSPSSATHSILFSFNNFDEVMPSAPEQTHAGFSQRPSIASSSAGAGASAGNSNNASSGYKCDECEQHFRTTQARSLHKKSFHSETSSLFNDHGIPANAATSSQSSVAHPILLSLNDPNEVMPSFQEHALTRSTKISDTAPRWVGTRADAQRTTPGQSSTPATAIYPQPILTTTSSSSSKMLTEHTMTPAQMGALLLGSNLFEDREIPVNAVISSQPSTANPTEIRARVSTQAIVAQAALFSFNNPDEEVPCIPEQSHADSERRANIASNSMGSGVEANGRFVCSVPECMVEFNCPDTLYYHSRIHARYNDTENIKDSNATCESCKLFFMSKVRCTIHKEKECKYRKVETAGNKNTFVCNLPHCQAKFTNRKTLKKHSKLHDRYNDQKNIKYPNETCEPCKLLFFTKHGYTEHKRKRCKHNH